MHSEKSRLAIVSFSGSIRAFTGIQKRGDAVTDISSHPI